MDMQFKRILNLVRRTGDRMVVTDQNGEDVYVVMGLDAYESLIEAQELLADAEAEGSLASSSAALEMPGEVPSEASLDEQAQHDLRVWEAMHAADEPGETWDFAKLSDEEKREVEQTYKELQEARTAKPAETPATTAEESPKAEEKPTESAKKSDEDDEEPGEEQFYLEPVE